MKFFFQYIIKIVVITFIVAFGIQYFLDYGLRNLKNTQINDWENILNGKINSEIIINGSSRGFVGYNSQIIGEKLNSSCFNISYNAGGYNVQQDKFDIYIKKNRKPKVVIQNIDFAQFIRNNELPEEWQFFPFLYNKETEYLTSKFETKFTWFKILPLLKYNQNIKLLIEGFKANFSNSVKKNAKSLNGYSPQNRNFEVDNYNLNRIKNTVVKSNDNSNVRLLYQMLQFYTSRLNVDTKIIFVWMPEHKLRLNEKFDRQRELLVDELNLLQKKHTNILFIDMAHDEISNHDENYYDTFHLSEKGANEFSKKVVVRINNFLN